MPKPKNFATVQFDERGKPILGPGRLVTPQGTAYTRVSRQFEAWHTVRAAIAKARGEA